MEEKGLIAAEPMNGGNGVYSCNGSIAFNIVDMGSSVGPNTFIAVQNIVEVVSRKFKAGTPFIDQPLEFKVHFNDRCTNDFNTLFASLPSERRYFAMGVPGTFHGRLFPKQSLHLVYSSYALQWLSRSPEKCLDRNSPGGMMVLIIPGVPNEIKPSHLPNSLIYELMASIYSISPKDIKDAVQRNRNFDIEKLEMMSTLKAIGRPIDWQKITIHIRAGLETLISKHFGGHIVDELFQLLRDKTMDYSEELEATSSEYSDTAMLKNRPASVIAPCPIPLSMTTI